MSRSFLKYFIEQCHKTNLEESFNEEEYRYRSLPWNDRIVKFLRVRNLIEEDPYASDT